jgi:hypothetical protein
MALVAFSFQRVCAGDFDATTETVGPGANGLVTPANQRITPAGIQIELPRVRPNALALSPDGKLLVTAGLTRELIAVNPATGKILQHVPFPADKAQPVPALADGIIGANQQAKLSFTGLAFSPDGSRIYLSNVNGDIKVFGVGKDATISPLFSIGLPGVKASRRTNDIPAGIAVSRDGKKFTSRATFPTACSNWMPPREMPCGRGTSASRRSTWCFAGTKFTSVIGAGGDRTPAASSARRDKAHAFAWMNAASPAKARCR